jgi:hypothetical protein
MVWEIFGEEGTICRAAVFGFFLRVVEFRRAWVSGGGLVLKSPLIHVGLGNSRRGIGC